MNFQDATIEPPLSPLPLEGLRRAPAPGAPASHEESPALDGPPPLPNRLLRMGLVTLPQLSAAMQQQAQTGQALTDILIQNGLISPEDLARLEEPAAPPETAPMPLAPEFVPTEPPTADIPSQAEPAPAPSPAPAAAPAAVPVLAGTPLQLAVVAQLDSGTRIELATFADGNAAREFATQAMRAVAHAGDEWPLIGGRFVRPQSVVTIEISALM